MTASFAPRGYWQLNKVYTIIIIITPKLKGPLCFSNLQIDISCLCFVHTMLGS